MKMDRRHMIGAVAMLGASIVWNVWVFTQPPGRTARSSPGFQPPSGETTPAGIAAVDPASLPAPPAVELSKEPAWTRNPFSRGTAAPAPELSAAPVRRDATPVVGAILDFAGRRSAIVDGRIVGIGDRVNGGLVLEITSDAVVVQRTSGERVRLPLNRSGGEQSRTP